ncbi:MAG: polysaccharide deacetylase family protein [Thermoanaerobaculia bacterium]
MGRNRNRVKKLAAWALCGLRVDRAFRHVNRKKLLTVMYHGVTRNQRQQMPWTQIPERVFVEQVEFLTQNYNLLHLPDVVDCLQAGRDLPERSALITFDDGLRNNFSVAFPILARFEAPAAIFVATDFIGTDRFYWFDELYLMMVEDPARDRVRTQFEESVGRHFDALLPEGIYWLAVEHLKRVSEEELRRVMALLATVATLDFEDFSEDFGVLDWSEIEDLQGSGLVDFGVHTANHRILSSLGPSDWEREIREPRQQLSRILGKEVVAFAYPNGRPGIDYSEVHKSYLLESGYLCAFSTEPQLVRLDADHAFEIGRLPAGNDITSEAGFFHLMCSGFPGLLRGG